MIRLKNAKDPDEYINKNGVEKFKEAVKNAMPATEFKISLIKAVRRNEYGRQDTVYR